jgi:hypothetical protein
MVTVFGELLELLLLLLLLLEQDKNRMENSKNIVATMAILFFIFNALSDE